MNYFSFEGIPFLVLAWAGICIFKPLVTLIHELGHALPALLLSDDKVFLRVGNPSKKNYHIVHRLSIEFSIYGGQEGCTGYTLEEKKFCQRILILLGGPLVSLLVSLSSGYFLFVDQPSFLWLELVLVSWFCANALAFLRAALPMRLKPTHRFPEGPLSDGLQIFYLIKDKLGCKGHRSS